MNSLARMFCAVMLSISSVAVAQSLGTGLYAFGSFDSRGFDSINIGNLNTHFEIPIVNKQGRGLPFSYTLAYDGLIWSTGNSLGTGTWQPDSGWGFHGVLLGGSFTGYVTHSTITNIRCPFGPDGQVVFGQRTANYRYHDPYGRVHSFDYQTQYCPGTDDAPVASGDGSTFDGSGYSYDLTDLTVHTRNGSVINTANSSSSLASGSITDSNGNTVTNNGNGTFADTLGVTALTISGSGTASSPLTLSYPVTLQANSATSAAMTIYYHTYIVQTNFQCSGIVEYGSTSVDLMDHITLADGSTYSFTYEVTPGSSSAVTGRLASITLPTGGAISYSYTNGCNGSSGINADGTLGGLIRTTSDGTRTYSRSLVNANATTTTLQDEKGNQSLYHFSNSSGMFYETHRQIYQGAIGGGALLDQYTCYNGVQPGCDGAVVTPPFSETITMTNYNNDAQLTVQNAYDASGMLTSSVQKSGSTPLESVANSYNGLEELTGSAQEDGSGNVYAYSYYGYDETTPTATSGIPQHGAASGQRGNQTSAHVSSGATYLTTTTAYYDTGAPISTASPNGTTQYSYDSTQTFTTQTTLPTPSSGVALATTATYDPQSGVQLSSTGMNSGQTTQITQYDALLRPTAATLPNLNLITGSYSPNQTVVNQPQGNGAVAVTVTLLDDYGRKSRVAVANGQSAAPWYQTDYCYDAAGLLQFQSITYSGNGWATPKQCSGNGTSYAYDALGRITSSANADGTNTTQYWGRAILNTDINGVRKIISHDLLGRISDVCEVSSNTLQGEAPQTCPGDIPGYTGFVTQYAYDLANHTTTISQGAAQTRTFKTDYAGRTIQTVEPERGTTNYSYTYNSTGLQVTRTRPQANQTSATTLTHTVTQYDSLGRPVTVSYDDGITPNKTFYYDTATLPGLGFTTGFSKGLLVGQEGVSADSFSYDIMGNIISSFQCLPAFCGHSGVLGTDIYQSYGYDLAGNLSAEVHYPGVANNNWIATQYTVNPAGQTTAISGGQNNSPGAPNIVNVTQEGPFGPVTWTLGNGLSGVRAYDSMGRNNGVFICTNGSTSQYCGNNSGSTAFYSYADIVGSQVAWRCDTSVGTCHNFVYDESGRLSTTNGFTGTAFTYAYDRYGNRWNQNALQGGPAPSYSFNTSTNQISGFSYDAAGNLVNDGLHTYQYDAEGNILKVDGGVTAAYVYSGLNRRVEERTNNGATVREIAYNIQGQRSAIWDGISGTMIQAQTYWEGRPVAFYSNGSIHYQHQDWIGTERSRTGYNGTVEGTYTSLPFGDGFAATGSDGDPAHFAMLDHDAESNMEHAQFRQYSSLQGRWMSPDPYDGSYDAANPQSLNRYSYVLNNPLGFIDPLGLMCFGHDGFTVYGSGAVSENGLIVDSCDSEASHGGGDDGPGELIYKGGTKGGGGGRDATAPDNASILRNGKGSPIQLLLPGMNYCGPGNAGGNPTSAVDTACFHHDVCYKNAGVTAAANILATVGIGPQTTQSAISSCNAQLCRELSSTPAWTRNEAGAITVAQIAFGCP